MPLGTDRLLRPGGGGGGGAVVLRGVIFLNELFWRGGGGNFLPCTKIRKLRGVKF